MPELPEVETTCRGLSPHVAGHRVKALSVYQPRLRIPVPGSLDDIIGQRVDVIHRRAKYLIFETSKGRMIIHLGMSGSLRICDDSMPFLPQVSAATIAESAPDSEPQSAATLPPPGAGESLDNSSANSVRVIAANPLASPR